MDNAKLQWEGNVDPVSLAPLVAVPPDQMQTIQSIQSNAEAIYEKWNASVNPIVVNLYNVEEDPNFPCQAGNVTGTDSVSGAAGLKEGVNAATGVNTVSNGAGNGGVNGAVNGGLNTQINGATGATGVANGNIVSGVNQDGVQGINGTTANGQISGGPNGAVNVTTAGNVAGTAQINGNGQSIGANGQPQALPPGAVGVGANGQPVDQFGNPINQFGNPVASTTQPGQSVANAQNVNGVNTVAPTQTIS